MFWLPKLQLLLVLRVQLHSGCNCCSQWLQLTFVVKYATLICKLCKYLHESLHHKTAEANSCNSFKYLLQRLQTKLAALKICNPGCTLDVNICSVAYQDAPFQKMEVFKMGITVASGRTIIFFFPLLLQAVEKKPRSKSFMKKIV